MLLFIIILSKNDFRNKMKIQDRYFKGKHLRKEDCGNTVRGEGQIDKLHFLPIHLKQVTKHFIPKITIYTHIFFYYITVKHSVHKKR